MTTITLDQLRAEELAGLKDPRGLLTAVNRLQAEAGEALNGGLTLANAWNVVLPDVQVVTPPDWTPLTLASGWSGAAQVRKLPGGDVRCSGVVSNVGAPATNTTIASLPPGHAPSADALLFSYATGGTIGTAKAVPSGDLQYIVGNTASFFTLDGSWLSPDKSLPAWSKPVRARLPGGDAGKTVRLVLCLARTPDGFQGILPTVTSPGAYIEPPAKVGEQRLLVLPRIDGLRENTRYSLTLWAFLE